MNASLAMPGARRRGSGSRLMLIVLLIAFVMAAIAVAPSIHAAVKHGSEANTARQCLDGRQATLFVNPTTNRWAVVCQVGEMWGVVILNEAREEITAFVKNKMKTFDQVLRYMKNAGYQVVQ